MDCSAPPADAPIPHDQLRSAGALEASPHDSREHIPQTLIICVGLPGSGKSTFAEALVASDPAIDPSLISRSWVRASQDDAPSRRRQECEAVVRNGLREGKNVIVDRVDFDPTQRAHFVNIADQSQPRPRTWCLIFDVFRTTLEHRLATRPSHPSIPDAETGLRVLRQMLAVWSPPNPMHSEGFDRIYTLPEKAQPAKAEWTAEDIQDLLLTIDRDGLAESGPRRAPMPPSQQNLRGGYRGNSYVQPRGGYRGSSNRGGYGRYGGGHYHQDRPTSSSVYGARHDFSSPYRPPYHSTQYAANHRSLDQSPQLARGNGQVESRVPQHQV